MPDSTTDTEKYELTDVQVDTLGLVNRGANQEEFFMLKSGDANEGEGSPSEGATAVTPQAEAEGVTKSIWQKLVDLVKRSVTEIETEKAMPMGGSTMPMDEEDSDSEEDEEDEDEAEKSATDTSATDTEVVTAPTAEVTTTKEETTVTSAEDSTSTPDTSTTVVETRKEDAPMADEVTISKAEYDSILVRLAKTEGELQKANEEKERQSFIAKAADYGYVPVAQTELAEQLHWLAKADAARAQWWEDVLKAMDNMVVDSAMFTERGTVQMPTTALDGVLKSDDPKTAIMNLPKHEAEAYLRKVRGR